VRIRRALKPKSSERSRRGLGSSARSKAQAVVVSLAVREADLRTSIRPTIAEVDLGALGRNAARIRAIVGPDVAVYGVVKADAYGHGAVAVAKVLESQVDGLAVSLVEEGLELRDVGVTRPILVLGAYYGRYHSEVLEECLTPVVYDSGEFEAFAHAPIRRRALRFQGRGASAEAGPWPVHVKVDTGMNRLGIDPKALDGFAAMAERHPRLKIDGLCTHLASADLASPDATRAQLALFQRVLGVARARGIVPRLVHAANTAGTMRFPEARFSAIRPGLALYGYSPSDVIARQDFEPVLSLITRVMALHRVRRGATVSYGGTWRARRESLIATLPIGYADGYPRHIAGAQVLVGGRRANLVGAVCMDMMMADVTHLPGVAVGDKVVLIGRDGGETILADDLARWAGTISYEVLCGISKRVPRLYRGGPRERGRASPDLAQRGRLKEPSQGSFSNKTGGRA
jgi:alanine racemase